MPVFYARAPLRIDFLGGGSDAPPFSSEHGGAVLNAGINRYATCRLETGPHLRGAHIRSLDYDLSVDAEAVESLAFDGCLDLLKAALRCSGLGGSFNLETAVDAPPQSGLGASAAVCVAVLAACRRALGQKPDAMGIARCAIEAERGMLKLAGGTQDQCGAALGGLHLLEFKDPAITVHDLAPTPDQIAGISS